MTISGENISPEGPDGTSLVCWFGDTATPATFVDVLEARCTAPPFAHSDDAFIVELGLYNGIGDAPGNTVPFVYYDDSRPPSVPPPPPSPLASTTPPPHLRRTSP